MEREKKKYVFSYGRRWYFRFKEEGLSDDFSDSDLRSKMVVCLVVSGQITGSEEPVRLFTLCNNYLDFLKLQNELPKSNRCFTEIIPGNSIQKPHFDVDFARDALLPDDDFDEIGQRIVNAVVDGIIAQIPTLNIARNILVLTSHGENKRSYHIVVNGYACLDHQMAKQFYLDTLESWPEDLEPYRKVVDAAVYSSFQQFRIVGSTKFGQDRFKRFEKTWLYHDQTIQYTYLDEPENEFHAAALELEASLVSFTDSCVILPPKEISPSGHTNLSSQGDLSDELITGALRLLAKTVEMEPSDPGFPFTIGNVHGPFIGLIRRFPTFCKTCNRMHEAENPYLIVITGKDKPTQVYFDCRRAFGKPKRFIGELSFGLGNTDPVLAASMALFSQHVLEKLTRLALLEPSIPTVPGKKSITAEEIHDIFTAMNYHLARPVVPADYTYSSGNPGILVQMFPTRPAAPTQKYVTKKEATDHSIFQQLTQRR